MRGARKSMRFAVWFTALAMMAGAAASFGQDYTYPPNATAADSAMIDSLAALADSLAHTYRFAPAFKNKVDADVSKVGMFNEFQTTFNTPWGSLFNFGVSGEEKDYRLRPEFEERKIMRLSDLHVFSLFWQGTASYVDSRVFSRTAAVDGGFTDFIFNDKTATLGSTYRKAIGPLRTDLVGSGGFIRSERAFKNDEGVQSGINGGVAYSLGDRVILQGRGALRGEWNQSTTVDKEFNDLGSNEDSLSAGVRFQATDSIRFEVKHSRYNGDRTFTDQARGSGGSQISGAENVLEENEQRSTRNTTLTLTSRFAGRFRISLTGMHDEKVLDYRERDTGDSRNVADNVSGNVSYTMPWKTVASILFETGETLNDFGPLSTSSYTDQKQRVSVGLTHAFSSSFSMIFNGSSQIQQSFYLKYAENPRDRDQVDTNLKLTILSDPFESVDATIGIAYTNSEVVNIDSLQSSNNRTRELWDLRPSFTWSVNPRFSIQQVYGLSFEYTDYAFNADQNLLDRGITFTNIFRYKPMERTDLLFDYTLFLHDNGSYLPDPVTGVRYYSKASEDRRDKTRIRVDYRAMYRVSGTRIQSISFFGEHQYSRLEEWTPGDFEHRDTTTDGQIKVGSAANYDLGPGKVVKFSVARVKRFSAIGSEKEKNYWEATSEIAYPF